MNTPPVQNNDPEEGEAPFDPTKWGKVLDQLNASSAFYRPKEGRTRLRIVPVPPTSNKFFVEVTTNYKGQIRTKYLITAIITEGKGVRDEMAYKVTPVVVSKTVLKAIIGLLAEGYDLLSPTGYGLTINRTGQSLDTDYSILPSKNPIPLPDNLEYGGQSIEEMAVTFEAWSTRNKDKGDGEGTEDVPFSSDGEDEDDQPRRPAGRPAKNGQRSGRSSSRDEW